MHGSLMRGFVSVALVIGSACVGAVSARMGVGSPNLEVRDDSGKLRCVLGKLTDGGYGLRVVGDGEQSIELSIDKGEMAIRGQVTEDSPFSLVGDSSGWLLTLKQRDGAVRCRLNEKDGLLVAHGRRDEGVLCGIKSQPADDGVTSLELRHPGEGDKSTGLAFVVDARGASLDLLRDGKSAAQLA